MDDQSLLQRFAQEGDEAAFSALVDRHLATVYGVTYRRTGNRELAEELAQNVFASLARKASKIPSDVILPGWLHRAAVFESAQALRSEYTRQSKMNTLSELSDQDGSSLPEAWNEVRPLLDEAIDQLNATERNMVLMRFVEERTLRQIGTFLGKSESATQRHLQRILEKLGSILRKRGVTATTAVLATSLGTELTRAAPTSLLSTSISKGALATASSAKTASIITTATLSMSKTTPLIVTGILLVTAVTTTSIIIGKTRAQRELSQSPRAEAPTSQDGQTAVSGAETKQPENGDSEADRVARIMKQMLALIGDPSTLHERIDAIRQLATQLESEDMEEALTFITQVNEFKAKRTLTYVLYGRWGQIDGEAASQSDFGTDHELASAAIRALAQGWATSDPQTAFAWYQKLKTGTFGQNVVASVLKDVLTIWMDSHPETAIAIFNSLSPDEQKLGRRAFLRHGDDSERAKRIAVAVEGIEDERLRYDTIEDFGERWARHDSPAAMAWFDSLKLPKGAYAFKAATEIAEPLLESDTAKAFEWLWPKIPEEHQEGMRKEMLEFVRDRWAKRDRTAAIEWLTQNGYDPDQVLKK